MKYWVVGVFIVFQLLLCDLAAQESLTIQQKVWMYRIISKTPTLHRSLSGFLKYEGPDFYTFDQKVDYELVSQFQTANPNSLSFDYAGIRATSSGIIAELSVKMALWEVNEYLKKYISHDLEFSDVLYAQLEKRLVRKIVGQVKPQKQQELVQVVMHPSLPIFKKLELLQEYSIDPNVKLALFKEWNQLLVKHLFERSQWYFNFLSEENQLMSNLFLAAGEGSGTAGMLYEYELNPNDSTQKWYVV